MANIDLKRGHGAGGEEEEERCCFVVVCVKDATDAKSKRERGSA